MTATGLIWLAVSFPKTIMEPLRPVYLGHVKPVWSTGAIEELVVKEVHKAETVSDQFRLCRRMYLPSIE
jgi:hypothetical protein